MTKQEILKAIQESNQKLLPYLIKYCKKMLKNKDDEYWDEDSLEDARFIYMRYFHEEYELSFQYLDAEIDEVYQEESFSFTDFLEEKSARLAEQYTGFIPKTIFEHHLDELQEYTLEMEQLMANDLKLVFDEVGKQNSLPVVFKEEDSERFIEVSTGDTYDYVELKTYTFRKYTPDQLLALLDEKLETSQIYFPDFINFTFENEDEFTWLNKNVQKAKAILITIAYDAGNIYLDYLDENGEKIEKENDWRYTRFMDEKFSFASSYLGIYFPFEIYDYINSDTEENIEPFKNKMNAWLTKVLNQSAFMKKELPCFIQEVFENDYLNISNNKTIDRAELSVIISGK